MPGKFDYPVNKTMVKKGAVKEVKGIVTSPQMSHLAIIFVPISISGTQKDVVYDRIGKIWAGVKTDYRARYSNRENFKLGETIVSMGTPDVWVCQGICLDQDGKLDNKAATVCIEKLIATAKYEQGNVHMSNFTGEDYSGLKNAVGTLVSEAGINVFFYDESSLVKRASK